MSDDLYFRLREKIDQYSTGFAATESGVEIKILKKLFTEDEAQMYLNLNEDLQTAEEIARKTGGDTKETEALLQRMTEKGHTFPRFPKKAGESFYYAAAPYAHGILEHQLHRMDKELGDLLEEHFLAGPISRPEPGLRTIPVQAAVDPSLNIATHDDAASVIRKKDRIALTECVCNYWQTIRGGNCDQPKEVCFLFDFYGEYYVARGMGRWVTREEALEKLKECDRAGLVPQFSNSENPEALCNCCPDCCGALRGLKQLPQPGWLVPTNHFARIEASLCTSCGTCIDRCPMDAVSLNADDQAQIDRDRCIGCGLCVTTCPTGALSLVLKPGDQRWTPPEKGVFMRPSKEFEDRLPW